MTSTDAQPVERMIDALATADRPGLQKLFTDEVSLRALLPRRMVECTGAATVAEAMLGWFDDAPVIEPLEINVKPIADLWFAGYRFALHGVLGQAAPEWVVEQHAYCRIAAGRIELVRLVCSGFRPAVAALDALGDTCATLTPRIAAGMRQLRPGEVLGVLTDDPAAPEGIAAWSRLTGHDLISRAAEGDATRFYLRRTS